MSESLGFPHDHGYIAWEHFLAQHVGKVNTQNFVRAFYGPLNKLDEVLNELYTMRWIETAWGSALDGCGAIVGLSRKIDGMVYLAFFGFVTQPSGRAFGVARMRKEGEEYSEASTLGDEEYRAAIIAKIALNNGHGTAEEIMFAIDTCLGISGAHCHDMGNATLGIYIPELLQSTDPRFYLIEQMIPKAGGVKIWIYLHDPIYVFGFVNRGNYYGFNVGVMARMPGSNIPVIGP